METTGWEWLDPLDPNAVHLKYVDDQYAVCWWYPGTNGSKTTTDPLEATCRACADKLSEIVEPTWSTIPTTENEETNA